MNIFWRDKSITKFEKNRKLQAVFQRVFNSEDGKIALNAILTDLRFFNEANSIEEKALNNYAKFFIRERLGLRSTKSTTDFIAETSASEGGY